MNGVDLDAIRSAQQLIAGSALTTPVWPCAALDAFAGAEVWLKCEHLQVTGSFKIRGALSFVRGLPAGAGRTGLVAASAGNHAQGVAWAARSLGLPVTVVMPAGAPLAKIDAARALGALVELAGPTLEDAHARAAEIASAAGRIIVPPFDSDAVIAGQGTVALEVLEQVPDVEEILVPAGGGGLLAGVAVAVKALRPSVRVVGVQSRAMDGIRRSLAEGRVVAVPAQRTIADGVAVAGPSERTLGLIAGRVDEVVSVGEEAIAHAVVFLLERAKVVAEGAGALAVAALQSGAYRPRGKTVAIVSGGNIDINLVGTIVRHGLAEAGRYRRLVVEVADTPGELALVAGAIGAGGANILEVEHLRESADLPVGLAMIDLVVEVNGPEHFQAVVAALRKHGLSGRLGAAGDRLLTPTARQRHRQD